VKKHTFFALLLGFFPVLSAPSSERVGPGGYIKTASKDDGIYFGRGS